MLDPQVQGQGHLEGNVGEEEEKVWLHCVVGAKVEVVGSEEDGSDEWVDADEEGGSSVSFRIVTLYTPP